MCLYWQFLLVDLRCHGDSASIKKRDPHTVASAALDVLKLVCVFNMFRKSYLYGERDIEWGRGLYDFNAMLSWLNLNLGGSMRWNIQRSTIWMSFIIYGLHLDWVNTSVIFCLALYFPWFFVAIHYPFFDVKC